MDVPPPPPPPTSASGAESGIQGSGVASAADANDDGPILPVAAIPVVSLTDRQPHVIIVVISCPFDQGSDNDSSGVSDGVAIAPPVMLVQISHPRIDAPRPARISSSASAIEIVIVGAGYHTSWPPYKS